MFKRSLFSSILFFSALLAPMWAHAFSDLDDDHEWAFPLLYLEEQGIIEGYDDGTVRPDNEINRAELIKILVEGLGHEVDEDGYKNCFPDVEEEWFAKYVCYALDQEWVEGYPDGTFQPSQTVNKVEALKIILNAFEIEGDESDENLFSDTSTEDWYTPYLNAAVEKNLIYEAGDWFSPADSRTRGQVADMMARILLIDMMEDDVYTEELGYEYRIFMLVNEIRDENGVEPLVYNPLLAHVAREHSDDMAYTIGGMSHDGSDGSTADDRIEGSGVDDIGWTGENIGQGSYGTWRTKWEAIEYIHYDIFVVEPDDEYNHRTTMLSTLAPFSEIGIGVTITDDYIFFTQDYISIL